LGGFQVIHTGNAQKWRVFVLLEQVVVVGGSWFLAMMRKK
jgi:hypothetical protein